MTRRIDQTVRPIARSLRGWSGEATNRSKPPDNVPTPARVAPEPRGNGVSASIRRRGPRLWWQGQNTQTPVSVVTRREPNNAAWLFAVSTAAAASAVMGNQHCRRQGRNLTHHVIPTEQGKSIPPLSNERKVHREMNPRRCGQQVREKAKAAL